MTTTICCEWGENALIGKKFDVIIIVDVLSFSTCVDIVVSNKSILYPYPYKDSSAEKYAEERNALLATTRNNPGYSLSPFSLINIPKDTRLVLPSPNGATLSFLAKANYVLTGCLRNATAIAKKAQNLGSHILVVPAGERWPDNSLRVAYEDLIGAGAIISELSGEKSVEAKIAENIFYKSKKQNFENIFELQSGKELIEIGFIKDVEIACQYNISNIVPILNNEKSYVLLDDTFG